jgi:pimeloyl-ACP methyl ester carboxylesterase
LIRRTLLGTVLALVAASGTTAAAGPVAWLDSTDARATRVDSNVFHTHATVYEAGPEHAPPVVLVHGLGADGARFWRRLIPALADEYRVIAVDLPGFGESGKPNALYSPEAYARFLDEIITRRTDEPVALVGHSMGASIALYYANGHPDRVQRMVLASAAGILHGTAYAHFLSRMGVRQFLPQVPGIGDAAGKLIQRVLTKFERLGPDPATALKSAESRQLYLEADPSRIAALALVSTDYSRIVRETQTPTLVLWGGEDEVTPLRVGYLLTSLMPHARLNVVEGGSHMFPLEIPDTFNRSVVNALALSPAAFGEDARDDYPREVPSARPDTERTAECRGERGRVFSGSYQRLLIHDCEQVVIRDAHIGRLEIIGSRVTIRNTRVHSDDVAMVLAHSTVEMTASRVHGAVAVNATGSRVDAAGVELVGERSAIRAPAPSVFTFSVSRVDSPHTRGYVHRVVQITSKNPL